MVYHTCVSLNVISFIRSVSFLPESTSSGKSISEEDLTRPLDIKAKRHKLSPLVFNQKLSPKHSTINNHFLTTVREQDSNRRHSIDTT